MSIGESFAQTLLKGVSIEVDAFSYWGDNCRPEEQLQNVFSRATTSLLSQTLLHQGKFSSFELKTNILCCAAEENLFNAIEAIAIAALKVPDHVVREMLDFQSEEGTTMQYLRQSKADPRMIQFFEELSLGMSPKLPEISFVEKAMWEIIQKKEISIILYDRVRNAPYAQVKELVFAKMDCSSDENVFEYCFREDIEMGIYFLQLLVNKLSISDLKIIKKGLEDKSLLSDLYKSKIYNQICEKINSNSQ